MNKATTVRPWKIMLQLTTVTALLGASLTATAQAPYEVVLVNGTMSGSEDMFFEAESTGSVNPWGILDELCSDRDRAFEVGLGIAQVENDALNGEYIDGIGGSSDGSGSQSMVNSYVDLYTDICDDRGPEGNFDILYTQCSMTMWSQGAVLRWVLPPSGNATMNILTMEREWTEGAGCTGIDGSRPNPPGEECREGEVSYGAYRDYIRTLTVDLERVMQEGERIPRGKEADLDVTAGGAGSEHLGVPTRAVKFIYEGTMNPMMMAAANSAEGGSDEFSMGEITMVSEGTAYVNSTDVPGAHIVSDFYTSLQQKVVPGSYADTLFGAMFRQMAGVMRHGFPLSLSQETAVRIEGMPELMVPTLGQKSFSEMNVAGVLHFMSDAEWCAVGEPPSDWRVVTLDEMLSSGGTNSAAAGSGAGAGTDASMPGGMSATAGGPQMSEEQAAEMASAMQQAAEAMENMTPEQKAMFEQLGLGGMMGGANPAAQQPAPRAASAGAAASSRAGSNMPPSEELNSGNLTESVQRHLEALGYDVGDINGESSLETTIAISTFQAEKGMNVTGEVSPQLLGILSAEVDSRR